MPSWKKVITSGSNAPLAQISASTVPTATTQNLLAIDPSTGGIMQLAQSSVIASGDNLGNHTATENLDLGTFKIFNASHITSSGDCSINTLTIGKGGGNQNTNTAIGQFELRNNTTGTTNTALGYASAFNTTGGDGNTAVGYYALFSHNNQGSDGSTAIGSLALHNFTGANAKANTAVGAESLKDTVGGQNNVAMGVQALRYNIEGNGNIAIGDSSGTATINGNTNTTSNDSIYIGNTTKPFSQNDTNQIIIGHLAEGAGSNSVVLGNDSITKTILKGDVGIGDSSPQSKLHVEITDSTTNAASNTYSDYCLALRNYSNTTNAFAGIAFDVSTETDSDSIGAAIKGVCANYLNYNHDTHLTFHTNDGGDDAIAERMRITNTGKVGIGDTAPLSQLHVEITDSTTN